MISRAPMIPHLPLNDVNLPSDLNEVELRNDGDKVNLRLKSHRDRIEAQRLDAKKWEAEIKQYIENDIETSGSRQASVALKSATVATARNIAIRTSIKMVLASEPIFITFDQLCVIVNDADDGILTAHLNVSKMAVESKKFKLIVSDQDALYDLLPPTTTIEICEKFVARLEHTLLGNVFYNLLRSTPRGSSSVTDEAMHAIQNRPDNWTEDDVYAFLAVNDIEPSRLVDTALNGSALLQLTHEEIATKLHVRDSLLQQRIWLIVNILQLVTVYDKQNIILRPDPLHCADVPVFQWSFEQFAFFLKLVLSKEQAKVLKASTKSSAPVDRSLLATFDAATLASMLTVSPDTVERVVMPTLHKLQGDDASDSLNWLTLSHGPIMDIKLLAPTTQSTWLRRGNITLLPGVSYRIQLDLQPTVPELYMLCKAKCTAKDDARSEVIEDIREAEVRIYFKAITYKATTAHAKSLPLPVEGIHFCDEGLIRPDDLVEKRTSGQYEIVRKDAAYGFLSTSKGKETISVAKVPSSLPRGSNNWQKLHAIPLTSIPSGKSGKCSSPLDYVLSVAALTEPSHKHIRLAFMTVVGYTTSSGDEGSFKPFAVKGRWEPWSGASHFFTVTPSLTVIHSSSRQSKANKTIEAKIKKEDGTRGRRSRDLRAAIEAASTMQVSSIRRKSFKAPASQAKGKQSCRGRIGSEAELSRATSRSEGSCVDTLRNAIESARENSREVVVTARSEPSTGLSDADSSSEDEPSSERAWPEPTPVEVVDDVIDLEPPPYSPPPYRSPSPRAASHAAATLDAEFDYVEDESHTDASEKSIVTRGLDTKSDQRATVKVTSPKAVNSEAVSTPEFEGSESGDEVNYLASYILEPGSTSNTQRTRMPAYLPSATRSTTDAVPSSHIGSYSHSLRPALSIDTFLITPTEETRVDGIRAHLETAGVKESVEVSTARLALQDVAKKLEYLTSSLFKLNFTMPIATHSAIASSPSMPTVDVEKLRVAGQLLAEEEAAVRVIGNMPVEHLVRECPSIAVEFERVEAALDAAERSLSYLEEVNDHENNIFHSTRTGRPEGTNPPSTAEPARLESTGSAMAAASTASANRKRVVPRPTTGQAGRTSRVLRTANVASADIGSTWLPESAVPALVPAASAAGIQIPPSLPTRTNVLRPSTVSKRKPQTAKATSLASRARTTSVPPARNPLFADEEEGSAAAFESARERARAARSECAPRAVNLFNTSSRTLSADEERAGRTHSDDPDAGRVAAAWAARMAARYTS